MAAGIEGINDYKSAAGLITELKSFKEDFSCYTTSGYLRKSASLREGDILAKAKKHAIMVIQGRHFRLGNVSKEVEKIQAFLNWYGAYNLEIDGSYGNATVAAVKSFQKAEGLTADGIFGSDSLAKAKAAKK